MKKLFVALSLGLLLGTGSSIASPLMSPGVMPVSKPVVQTVPVQSKMLNTYRQVRAFWLSRALVR